MDKLPPEQDVFQTFSNEIKQFPLRRLYFFMIIVLTIFSLFGLTIQTENTNLSAWKVSAEFRVSTNTLILLLVAWLPLIISWAIRFSPRIQQMFTGLRSLGIEEIRAGILEIKLSPGIEKAVEAYGSKIQDTDSVKSADKKTSLSSLQDTYKEVSQFINSTDRLDPQEAMSRINQLCNYYDRVRDTMPSGHNRTKLFTDIAATMWSLMPNIEVFPVLERLKSPNGGERISAYKYIEWKPTKEYIELLLSRSAGVLEFPYGQYNALLALRRVVTSNKLSASEKELVISILKWNSLIDYMEQDRRRLMTSIITILNQP